MHEICFIEKEIGGWCDFCYYRINQNIVLCVGIL